MTVAGSLEAARRITPRRGSDRRSGFRDVWALANTTLVVAVLGYGAPAIRPADAEAGTPPTAAFASAESAASLTRTQKAPVFPLHVEPGKRYLVDAAGQPFLIQGDAAWSLIADLTREEADLYLDDRQARGFNTLLVNLIEHRFATRAPANAYGDQPFSGRAFEAVASLAGWLPSPLTHYGTSLASLLADFTSPNEAYFAQADWVLRRAAEKGFLILLAPSYAGWHGGSQGWYSAMVANGPDRLRQYGAYLGRRYRDFTNIVWVQGGDYDPPDKDLVRAIADGIREFDPDALQTAHGAPGKFVADYWQGEPWLQLDNVYTYEPIYAPALAQYARPGQKPFFLIESAYENERGLGEERVRMQAYQALLCGASGQIFGNNPIWHFDGPGLFPEPLSWQQALDSPGARSMTRLHELMATLPWWQLEPDAGHALLTDGLGPETRGRSRRAPPTGRSRSSTCRPAARSRSTSGNSPGRRSPPAGTTRRAASSGPSPARRSRQKGCNGSSRRTRATVPVSTIGCWSCSPRLEDLGDAAISGSGS